jgi:DNA-binding NarL/FixJ family response regulator
MQRILLADDNPEIRSALRLLLETRLDMELINEARDMEHVLAQMEDAQPACIILDWDLPGRPTRGRISVLRALVPELTVIVINTRPELREDILTEGADAFICKTDPPERLLDALSKFFLGSSIHEHKQIKENE